MKIGDKRHFERIEGLKIEILSRKNPQDGQDMK